MFAPFRDGSIVLAILLPLVLVGVLLLSAVVYVLARWRHQREYDVADPQLGLKAAWSFFKLVGFQGATLGVFLLIDGLLTSDTPSLRAGIATFLVGAAVYAVHWAAMRMTNHREFPHTMRMFSGLNLIIVGTVAIIATAVALASTLQQRPDGALLRSAWALSGTYLLSWALCTRWFLGAHAPSFRFDAGAVRRLPSRDAAL